jgi:hypothetical protein
MPLRSLFLPPQGAPRQGKGELRTNGQAGPPRARPPRVHAPAANKVFRRRPRGISRAETVSGFDLSLIEAAAGRQQAGSRQHAGSMQEAACRQHAGSSRQQQAAAGSSMQAAADSRQQTAGSMQQAAGSSRQQAAAGSSRQQAAAGSRQQTADSSSRQQAAGSRQQAAGSRQAAGRQQAGGRQAGRQTAGSNTSTFAAVCSARARQGHCTHRDHGVGAHKWSHGVLVLGGQGRSQSRSGDKDVFCTHRRHLPAPPRLQLGLQGKCAESRRLKLGRITLVPARHGEASPTPPTSPALRPARTLPWTPTRAVMMKKIQW